MADRVPFKEGLNADAVRHLRRHLEAASSDFDGDAFEADVIPELPALELKDRVRRTIAGLRRALPDDYLGALDVVLGAARDWQPLERDDGLGGFGAWPLIDFVGEYGVAAEGDAPDPFDASMEALRAITGLWSAEFAVRPFLIADPDRAFGHLRAWLGDDDHHVRRLISEGTRTRLPWGQRLPGVIDDPAPVFELLEGLRWDESEYVRRSVANNLNDLSKDHPGRVVERCERWWDEAPGADAGKDAARNRRRLVRHALRTLVKAGDPGALGVLGYRRDAEVAVEHLHLDPPTVWLGEALTFTFDIVSKGSRAEPLVVDYALHMTKSAGHRTAKVFKLKTLELASGDRVTLEKRHSFKKVTVRTYHPGRYAVEILVNGASRGLAEFDFEV
ncbi:MAG: DNA alkylation repair protein [Acidobacteriota bacterium]